MEELILRLIAEYHYLTYPLVLVATFIEGETIVILLGAAASAGEVPINVELLALAAFTGSFCGDQLYYLIGRRYGAPLLNRWPTLGHKIEWAFQLVKDHPILFILSFRFIYGIRNIAPFVIGIAGVPRMRYLVLNFIAAQVWAHSFAWGGYLLGKALEHWLGDNKWYALLGFFVLALAVGAVGYAKQKRKLKAIEAKEQAEGVCVTPSSTASE